MTDIASLSTQIQQRFGDIIDAHYFVQEELTLEVPASQMKTLCLALRDEPIFGFNQLMDVCGVDYLHYGLTEWETENTTVTGFSRAVGQSGVGKINPWTKPRFAAVYHLLSISNNHRIRLRVFANDDSPQLDSVVDIWPSANWFEREAFDLYGIVFAGHPDLRRILTDYDFVGYPFRKDFPLIGQVEMRYDATLQRCIYEPVSIQPRVLVPKVIRNDARYVRPNQKGGV